MRDIEIAHALADTLRQRSGFGRADPGEKDREFLAAAAGDQLTAAARGPDQHAGNPAQTIIAGRVTVDVVEALEAVDVEQQQGEVDSVAHSTAPLGIKARVERASVGDAGERIDRGEPAQLSLSGRQFGVEPAILD
jgi:hypothetical protein